MKNFPCIWCIHATPGGYFCTGYCDMTEEARRDLEEQLSWRINLDEEPWAYRGLCPACKQGGNFREGNIRVKEYGDRTRTCWHCDHTATVREWIETEDAAASDADKP